MEKAPTRSWFILAACIVIAMLDNVSGAVLNLAMPEAARDVRATMAQSQLILLLGKLSLGVLLVAGGGLGDHFGRKRVILVGVTVVTAAAVLSAVASSAQLLALARTLDGVGNALIGPLALVICIEVFPPEMRARVIGMFLGGTGASIAIGPFLAGVLIQMGGWRVGFAATLVLAVFGGALIVALVRAPRAAGPRPDLDLPGMILCVVGLTGVVLGISLAGNLGWLATPTLGLLGLGTACLAAFARWTLRGPGKPLIDRTLLKSRPVLVALLAAMLMSLILNGTVLPFLYFTQRIYGAKPIEAVLRLLPAIIAALLAAPVAGGLAERFGRRPVMAAGLVLGIIGSAILATLTPATPYPVIFVGLVLIGAGMMTVVTPAADLVMATTGSEYSGSAAALNAAVIQVGGAVGIGVLTSTFINAATRDFHARAAALGYSQSETAEYFNSLRAAVRESSLQQMPQLPAVPPHLQADLVRAYADAAAIGVAHCFALGAVLALLGLIVVVVGMPRESSG